MGVWPSRSDLYFEAFAATMIKSHSSGCGSMASRMEADISPLPMFTKRWTPLVHEMIDHSELAVLPKTCSPNIEDLLMRKLVRSQGHLAAILASKFSRRAFSNGDRHVSPTVSSFSVVNFC
jgi:hypothetical protein